MGSFISGIKVYAYANEHTPERKMILSTYFQMLQTVVIEDTVIYPLTGSAFLVNVFVLLGIPRYTGLETQVAVVLYVNGAPITARGTFSGMRVFLNAAVFQRTAVFMCIFDRIIPHGHISCSALQIGWPSLLKMMSSGAFSEDFALPLMSISAFMSRRSNNS